MLKIDCRNINGIRLHFEYADGNHFIQSFDNDDDYMSDCEILLVELDGKILYSSLGLKSKKYDDTLRTMDLYDWFMET